VAPKFRARPESILRPKPTLILESKLPFIGSGDVVHDLGETILEPGQQFFILEVVATGDMAVLIKLEP